MLLIECMCSSCSTGNSSIFIHAFCSCSACFFCSSCCCCCFSLSFCSCCCCWNSHSQLTSWECWVSRSVGAINSFENWPKVNSNNSISPPKRGKRWGEMRKRAAHFSLYDLMDKHRLYTIVYGQSSGNVLIEK